jgi:alkaline phosphatase D
LISRRHFTTALFAQATRITSDPFPLGVASGDPLPDGIVLWTRLIFNDPQGPITVHWDLSKDESFRTILKHGTVTAHPDHAHCVHVDVRGLEPQHWYWYRFRIAGPGGMVESPTGRTRTAPRANQSLTSYQFAYASCQKYEDGFYTAWQHLAKEDLELVLFLGDYIYQGAAKQNMPRPHPRHEAMTLADYRDRYALYKSDPHLKLAHQSFPFMVIWDDHELSNDYSGQAIDQDPSLQPRRNAAYKAFYEHMPLRGGITKPLYRSLDLGTLARLMLLDTRRYKSPLACGGAVKPLCPEATQPARTMLGPTQETWLHRAISTSKAPWQIIAQQIPFAPVDRLPGPDIAYQMDKWDGYPAARQRLTNFLRDRAKSDTVILTGDNHNAWVMQLPNVATEFVCTSISSTGDGSSQRKEYAAVLSDNPHARYLNSLRGYTRCTVTPKEWRTTFLTVPYVTRPNALLNREAVFVLHPGSTALEG